MAKLSFKIDGVERVRKKLRPLANLSREVLEPVVKDFAKVARRTLKSTKYPPKRPVQRYRRTGRLGNSWATQKRGTALWTVVNKQQYASFVVGNNQAWMHKGRWWKAGQVVREISPSLRQRLQAALRKLWQ